MVSERSSSTEGRIRLEGIDSCDGARPEKEKQKTKRVGGICEEVR